MTYGSISSTRTSGVDGVWMDAGKATAVEVKKTNSIRDVREAFLALAYALTENPDFTQAVCVLIDTKLSTTRLSDELKRFYCIARPDLAHRLEFLVRCESSRSAQHGFEGSMEVSEAFANWLRTLIESEARCGRSLPISARHAVVSTLVHLCLTQSAPITLRQLQEESSTSYPTTATVLNLLTEKGLLEDRRKRGIRLRSLGAAEWVDLAAEHARARKTVLFANPLGLSSPKKLALRLHDLQAQGRVPASVRVAGVLGAAHHYPLLDITASPRLDLSTDMDPDRLAQLLDAALCPIEKTPHIKPVLAVHVTRDPGLITRLPDGIHYASHFECLADLIELGYLAEAHEFARNMTAEMEAIK